MSENMFIADSADFEHLLTQGFSAEEAGRLVYMKDHVVEQIEYREMVEEQHRLDFIRWLVEHDRINQ